MKKYEWKCNECDKQDPPCIIQTFTSYNKPLAPTTCPFNTDINLTNKPKWTESNY
jgi:hypothetical protein